MRSVLPCLFWVVTLCAGYAQTPTENYILSRTYKTPATIPATSFSPTAHIEEVTYFDGLGRPKQKIGVKQAGGTAFEDLVTLIEYDQFGREVKKYLFYPDAMATGGFFKTGDIAGKTKTYYHSSYAADFPDLTAPNTNPYSETHFEASPLNRVLEQGAPGKDWKINPLSDLDNTVKFNYKTNVANGVRRYVVNLSSAFQPTLVNPYISSSYFYPAGVLFKTITKDENWTSGLNNTTEEFKDKQGRVVLKRTYTNTDLNNDGDTTDLNEQQVPHDTYYVYDDYGNLTYVIPPKADGTTTTVAGTTKLNDLCYQYKYDHRNRLVEKKVPGKGWEYIIYNKLDQPILTQDEVQRNKNPKEWLFTKYDAFGRVIMTGIHTYGTTTAISQASMQSEVNNYATREEKTATAANNYYTNLSYPTSNLEVLTLNYYDNYTFDTTTQGLIVASGTDIFGNLVSHNVKGLSTGSKVKVLDQSPVKWITTVNHYDKKGRVLYTGSYNEFLLTTDKVKMELDFMGLVKKTDTYHKRGTNTAITTIDNFTYDHVNRLTQHTQTIGTKTELIAHNTYSKTGEMITKKVGNTSGAPLQIIDYTYNIRGWLKQINNPGTLGDDLFGFKLNYNTTEMGITGVQPLYNGNISETLWRTANTQDSYSQKKRGYAYQYDHLNRITAGNFRRGNSTGSLFNEQLNDYNVSGITYDKNGNIGRLNRRGVVNVTNGLGDMDKLNYTYDAGNRLMRVSDLGSETEGFKDDEQRIGIVDASDDYAYDPNGNMLTDSNKGITGITYNHLNLPKSVSIGGGTITYIYDATGVKQRKVAGTTTTDYAGNYMYKNGTLQFFNHPEGYVENNAGTYKYHYHYKDHLGNIRLSYFNNGTASSPSVVISEENNYYPFGLRHKGYNDAPNGYGNIAAKMFKFGGKELQDETIGGKNVDWYDFHARNYDAALGRWMNIDPLAEDYYSWAPYNYTYNNPLKFIDPTGMAPEDITVRARSEASNGDYVAIAVIKTDIVATVDLDLDVSRAPLIDGITGAEKPIEINGQHIDPKADAFGLSITASVSAGYGEGVVKNVVAFLNGPEKGNAFLYEASSQNLGLEGSLTIGADNYFSNGDINTFNRFTLTGKEVGIDLSNNLGNAPISVGTSGFAGVDLTSKNPIPYVGYSKTVSGAVGSPIRGYISDSKLIRPITKE